MALFLNLKGFSIVSKRELAFFSRQLASLLNSGVSMLRALEVYWEQAENKYFKAVVARIRDEIKNGRSFSSSVASYPAVFSPFYRAMIKAGEDSGSLDGALQLVAGYYRKETELAAKVKAALAYPALILAAGILTVLFIFIQVMPQIIPVFDSLGLEKPLATELLILISNFFRFNWIWISLGGVLFAAIFQRALKNELFLYHFSLFRLGLPLLGSLFFKSDTARFSRALAIALGRGVPVIPAVESAIPVLTEHSIRRNLEKGCRELAHGRSLKDIFSQSNIFPPFVISLVNTGEESGRLADSFADIADAYEQDCQELVKTLTNLLEPAMILAVGLFVGFIVAAVLVPVLNLDFIRL